MSLVSDVAEALRRNEFPFALIGAAALAVRGVGRSTFDHDLLTTERSCLADSVWAPLTSRGIAVEIRKGDAFDPLAGVVVFESPGQRPVDLVVGKHGWMSQLLERAEPTAVIAGYALPVVRAADLILLKLFAGGSQDAWDIEQLLAGEDREALVAEVEREIAALPKEAGDLWRKILGLS
jgi:hypothetical protein